MVGHGVDLVEISRIERMMSDHAERFLERCFTAQERAYREGGRRYAEHIAARFAAKEAAMKAIGRGLTSGIHWTDFSVQNLASGQPELVVVGAAKLIADQQQITRWLISLTHTDTTALASVIALAE